MESLAGPYHRKLGTTGRHAGIYDASNGSGICDLTHDRPLVWFYRLDFFAGASMDTDHDVVFHLPIIYFHRLQSLSENRQLRISARFQRNLSGLRAINGRIDHTHTFVVGSSFHRIPHPRFHPGNKLSPIFFNGFSHNRSPSTPPVLRTCPPTNISATTRNVVTSLKRFNP